MYFLCRSKRLNRASKRLPEDLLDQFDDEPLDLLDRQKIRSSLRGSESLKRKSESDDEFEVDEHGRLIINEGGGKRKNKKFSEDDTDARSRATSAHSALSQKQSVEKYQSPVNLTAAMNMPAKKLEEISKKRTNSNHMPTGPLIINC